MSVTVHAGPMLDASAHLIDLATARAKQGLRPTFLTIVELLPTLPNPLAFLAASSSALGNGAFWSQPQDGQYLAGAGAAWEVVCDGPTRFGYVTAAVRQLRDSLVGHDQTLTFPLLGGFAFDDAAPTSPVWHAFPAGRLIAPQVLLQCDGGHALLRITERVDESDTETSVAMRLAKLLDQCRSWLARPAPQTPQPQIVGTIAIPDRHTWEASVATAVSLIHQGAFDKVVLAREERLIARAPFSPIETLARLRRLDADATLFAVQSGQSWFLGASPERLVRLKEGQVDVTCLAGSIALGDSMPERRRLADNLLASQKDRLEHEIVVRSTMTALENVCQTVSRLPGTPRGVSVRSVQHLETPLSCRLKADASVLDLVERLHPTPAVGGYPRDRALSAMRELEELDRGWYAGPIGWTDLSGSGEFAVAIRSALLTGCNASLFAGSGIVADSVPSDEFEETQLKFLPMRTALGDS
jgi:menaquinone-specific isochorismate synthase